MPTVDGTDEKSNAPSQGSATGRTAKETPEAAFITDWVKITIFFKVKKFLIAGPRFMNGYRIN